MSYAPWMLRRLQRKAPGASGSLLFLCAELLRESEGRTTVSMSAEENKAIMRRFWDVWEEGNIELLDELLAPEYINHTLAAPDLPPGPEGVKAVVSMFRSAMSDLKVVIEDMVAEGEKVVTRYALEGTHKGELFGVAPTGRGLSIKSMTVERVVEGKIIEHWRVTDEMGMMRQLGVFGAPENNYSAGPPL
jgi:steroid delta-isomerase-like uncharacterized protein